MSTIPQAAADFADFLPLRRFSTADYLQMIEAGWIVGRWNRPAA